MKTGFALALVLAFVAGTAVAADGSVTGHYRAEGHDAKLSFVRTAKGTSYSDLPTIVIAFTEKDASDATKVDSDIAFSHKYGSAITMNVTRDQDGVYDIDKSALHHTGSDKAGGNVGGVLQLKDLTVANGIISGEVYTQPGAEVFGAALDIDLKFKAALPK